MTKLGLIFLEGDGNRDENDDGQHALLLVEMGNTGLDCRSCERWDPSGVCMKNVFGRFP